MKNDALFENFYCISKTECKSARLLRLPIGVNEDGRLEEVEIGTGGRQHIMVCGHVGSGKSIYLQTLIHSVLLNYSADDVQLWLSDSGTCEFDCFAKIAENHIERVSIESKTENYVDFIDALKEEVCRRRNILIAEQENSYDLYWRKNNKAPFPRLIVVIDSFNHFANALNEADYNADYKYTWELDHIARYAHAYGITFVISVQSLDNLFHRTPYGFFERFDTYIMTRQPKDFFIRCLGADASDLAQNMKLGDALVNVPFLHKVTLLYISRETRMEILRSMSEI